ncbi:MAG: metallophosphoesterase [Clostridia bacterium]|nr:metallophosphoesterase [Clostridia bacterium]
MAIYVIGDLHLSLKHPKPMDIFGNNWENHAEKIKEDWLSKVKNQDLVVLPGDFSWETYLGDTDEDFKYLNSLPGKKVLLKGNHDYWWTTLTSMKNYLKENNFENIDFIYNNSYEFENYIIAGTRGWSLLENDNEKMINRECNRLELSLKDAVSKNTNNDKEIIAFIHYPPIVNANLIQNQESNFIRILKKYNVKRCYYAHLHANSINDAIEGNYFGIDFKLVSSDSLNFKLLKI